MHWFEVVESALRGYSRIAPTERGGYRLARLARKFRPTDRWVDIYKTPFATRLRLDAAVYPDCAMAHGLYELDTVRVIRNLLRPGDVFVDAGANIGYITLIAAARVGAAGKVYAFEPQPDNFRRLSENLAINANPPQVEAYAMALSDRAGETTIYYPDVDAASGDNHGTSSVFLRADIKTKSSTIATQRLDAVLPNVTPRLVKIDVEGAEPLVIDGMHGQLTHATPPMIVIEHNPTTAANAGFAVEEAIRRVFRIQPRYDVWKIGLRLRPLRDPLSQLPRLGQCNLLLRPRVDTARSAA